MEGSQVPLAILCVSLRSLHTYMRSELVITECRHPKESREGLPPRRPNEPSPAKPDKRGHRDERRPSGRSERESSQKQATPPRLSTIPAEIRKAALEAQQREQARVAAKAAAAEKGKSPDEEGEVCPVNTHQLGLHALTARS